MTKGVPAMPSSARPVRRTRFLLAVALLATFLGWATASPARAHDDVEVSEPAEASLVEVLPSRAVLMLSGDVRKVRDITVTGPDGDVANGKPSFLGREVRQNLWAGPEGAYVMAYDIVSSDGHRVSGEIHFDVGPVSGPIDGSGAPAAPDGSGPLDGPRGILIAGALLVVVASGLVVVRRRRLA